MALHASWVHGVLARPQWVGDKIRQVAAERWDESRGDVAWSDVNGLPEGFGVTYRCADSRAPGLGGSQTAAPPDAVFPFRTTLKGYWFHFAVPTPVIVADRPARLLRTFVLWTATPDLQLAAVHVWDGARRIATLLGGGRASDSELIPGGTQFDLATPELVHFGIGISVGISCTRDANVTFHAAGADFDI